MGIRGDSLPEASQDLDSATQTSTPRSLRIQHSEASQVSAAVWPSAPFDHRYNEQEGYTSDWTGRQANRKLAAACTSSTLRCEVLCGSVAKGII